MIDTSGSHCQFLVQRIRQTVARVGCAILLLVVTQLAAAAQDDELQRQAQREQFVAARAALEAGDLETFEQLTQKLDDYPIQAYLRFEELQQRWKKDAPTQQSVAELNAFEQRSDDVSMTRRLTQTLQERLAATEQWALFLGVSESRLAASMNCTHVRADYELGRNTLFNEQVLALWVEPVEHAAICSSVLKAIEAAHTPPVASIWERIYNSMDARQAGLC